MSFITLFSRDVPIGWARNLIQTCADKINQASSVMEEAQANQKTGPVNDAFKDLFNTALDDIWKG
jgi:capsid protein